MYWEGMLWAQHQSRWNCVSNSYVKVGIDRLKKSTLLIFVQNYFYFCNLSVKLDQTHNVKHVTMIHTSQNDTFRQNIDDTILCPNSWFWHNVKHVTSQYFLQKYHKSCETKLFLIFHFVTSFRIDTISVGFRLESNQELWAKYFVIYFIFSEILKIRDSWFWTKRD